MVSANFIDTLFDDIRGLDALSRYYNMGDNFYAFLFGFLHSSLQNSEKGFTIKRICTQGGRNSF